VADTGRRATNAGVDPAATARSLSQSADYETVSLAQIGRACKGRRRKASTPTPCTC